MKTIGLTYIEQQRLFEATLQSLSEKRARGESRATRADILFDFMAGKRGLINMFNVEEILQIREAQEFKREYYAMRAEILRLKRLRYIKELKVAEGMYFVLTAKGSQEQLRHAILTEQRLCAGQNVCYVIYDIPEAQKPARRTLRNFLKQAHFTQVQKSIWMTRRDITKPLRTFIKDAHIERWVTIIEGIER